MPERMQHDFVPKDIVAQAVISPSYAPLPLAGFKTGELFDLVPTAAVVGIVG